MNKEECLKALETLQDKYLNFDVVDELICFKSLIEDHFDNPPFKFEELEDGEWYWCDYYGWILTNFYYGLDCKTHYEVYTLFGVKEISDFEGY